MKPNKCPLLLVDDDVDIREAMRDTLATEGYEMVEAADGQRALDYLRANPETPLVLLDWNMAPMNGPQFMAELAKDVTLSNIPVVLLTADMRAPEKAKSEPFSGYLIKPVTLDALFEVVDRYCG